MTDTVNVGSVEITINGENSGLLRSSASSKKELESVQKKGALVSESLQKNFDTMKLKVGIAVTAIVAAVRSAVNSLDALSKSAQGIGLTTEQFSRLEYAAGQAGVRTEELTGALQSLIQRASERDELSEGVLLFQALGISARDAGGQIRPVDRILQDLAGRFSQMKDSSQKTELAVKLFGDAGRRLIPLLNQGSSGMAALAAEADRLGVTIDSTTAKSAEEFNNVLNRLTASAKTLAQRIVAENLPAMTMIARQMEETSKATGKGSAAFQILDGTLKALLITGEAARALFGVVTSSIGGVLKAVQSIMGGKFQQALKDVTDGINGSLGALVQGQKNTDIILGRIQEEAPKTAQVVDQKFKAPIVRSAADITKALEEVKKKNALMLEDLMASNFEPYSAKIAKLEEMLRRGQISFRDFTKAVRELNNEAAQNTLNNILSTDTTPFANKITELNALVERGAINWQTYSEAVKQVSDQQKNAMNDLLSTTSSALTSIFEKSKTAAIASALINTFQGITKALSSYPPPYSFAMAGLQAAMGFAQVAKIRSTTQGGGGGGGATTAPSVPAATQETGGGGERNQTLTVQGIDPNTLLSGTAVRSLAERLLQFQRDGGRVVLA